MWRILGYLNREAPTPEHAVESWRLDAVCGLHDALLAAREKLTSAVRARRRLIWHLNPETKGKEYNPADFKAPDLSLMAKHSYGSAGSQDEDGTLKGGSPSSSTVDTGTPTQTTTTGTETPAQTTPAQTTSTTTDSTGSTPKN